MHLEFGNVKTLDTNETGWFIGFSDWTKEGPCLRYVATDQKIDGLCVKWMQHPVGDRRGDGKPVSTGRTISMLVSETGAFRLEFSEEDFCADSRVQSYTLRQQGDFVIWGAGLFHRSIVESKSTILTIRWELETGK